MRGAALGKGGALLVAAALVGSGAWKLAGCSIGDGAGVVRGTLDVPDCWSGQFDLAPDFFGAVPYRDRLELRIQKGGDYETFTDGVSILIDNAATVRGASGGPSLLNQPLVVSLPAGVSPPGVPLRAESAASIVHMSLYLQHSCRVQAVALYAMEEVLLDPDGTCSMPNGPPKRPICPGGSGVALTPDGGVPAGADAGGSSGFTVPPSRIGRSKITFAHLFNGNADETDAQKRLSEFDFDVYLADPREVCPGGVGSPPPCRGHLTTHDDPNDPKQTGSVRFYFQRGRPSQPFP